mgnify:CR=1 FL=1
MNAIRSNRYTTAHTAPIVSGLVVPSVSDHSCLRTTLSYISGLLTLAISLPFSPAFMNVGPSHRIRLYDAANPRRLKAKDTVKGRPSSRSELAVIPTDTPTNAKRHAVSDSDRRFDCLMAVAVFGTW